MKMKKLFRIVLCRCTAAVAFGLMGLTATVQHRLYMKNGIHGSWCRTTPLWGRGLSQANTGADDRLHDCRARNEIEAITWHGYSRKSEAFTSTERFYNLAKDDRDAIVKFLRSI